MCRLLIILTLVLVIGTILGRPHKFKGKYDSHRRPGILSKFCSNTTIAQNYLTKILSLIHKFQSNASYDSVLKLQSIHFINYASNRTNQELLHRDCQAFSKGLMAARKLDKLVDRTRKHLASIIQNEIQQVSQRVNNGKGFHEIDD
ncbi:unnamed protein product [Adineta ricciae]|uniref:Uncharacterized protein n=1 Tax=Adineta ricciae TaxID=249248 RepID=A0A815ZW59_ADIRI|nr:unnamed protein product [Adineta ricciae]CAF1588244.1 unnamed protein product [Adineta ricciae]